MRKLRRDRNRKQIRILLGGMVFLLCIMTAGYAAFSTNVTLNAKGNLIYVEKYSPSDLTSAENLQQPSSTSAGLYADSTESGRYVYKGANPDNYITIGNEEYRIIAIESDGSLKVIKSASIGSMAWDPGYETEIDGLTEANSIVGTRYSNVSSDYCYASSDTGYKGCKSWGSSTTTLDGSGNNVAVMIKSVDDVTTYNLPSTEAYINTYINTMYLPSLLSQLNSTMQSKIIEHVFNVGPIKLSGTLAQEAAQEAAYKWRGKAGLMNITDYVKASTNSSCTSVNIYNTDTNCYENSADHNWLFNSDMQWTLSLGSADSSDLVMFVGPSGRVAGTYRYTSISRTIRPVLYLSSDIKLRGDGTQANPYKISLS